MSEICFDEPNFDCLPLQKALWNYTAAYLEFLQQYDATSPFPCEPMAAGNYIELVYKTKLLLSQLCLSLPLMQAVYPLSVDSFLDVPE